MGKAVVSYKDMSDKLAEMYKLYIEGYITKVEYEGAKLLAKLLLGEEDYRKVIVAAYDKVLEED